MAVDQRFFETARPLSFKEIVEIVDGSADAHSDEAFTGVSSLETAEPLEVSFCETRRYANALRATRAGAVLVTSALRALVPPHSAAILCDAPAMQFARLAAVFHRPQEVKLGIHPLASIAPDAFIGDDCEIGPFAVIGANARLGKRCSIGPHAHIAQGVILGDDCVVHSHVTVAHAICGDRVVLFPGARVGQEGFGFSVSKDGKFVTAPQLGLVELGDDVHVGANSCIDRGGLGNTVLAQGTRLDNLVQVGHNVKLGKGCILVAQVGVSGSTIMGDYVSAGGQSGFAGHLTVGTGTRIAAQSGVMDDVPPGSEVFGSPALPIREAVRALHVLRKLAAESRNVKKRPAE